MVFGTVYNFIVKQVHDFHAALSVSPLLIFAEVAVLGFFLWFFYVKFIKGTSSEKLVRGVFILAAVWFFSELLIRIKLQIIGMFLKTLVGVITFGLIVIFQPELRKFLGYIGQGDFFSKIFLSKGRNLGSGEIDVLKELMEAIKYLSKFKIGGLIVIQPNESSNISSDVGTKINADISTELLLTIFHPKTPLHDGAVLVLGDKILAAGVLLPLTEDPKLSWRYGTRHRAAIGVTEVSDCACIVVSEETGDVSIAIDGVLKKYDDLGQLKTALERIIGKNADNDNGKNIFKFDLIRHNVAANKTAAKEEKQN